MNFWISISAILALSVLLLLFIIKRRSPLPVDLHQQRIARNVQLYRQRLAHLDADLQQGEMSQDVYASLTNDLSRNLLSDIDQLESAPGNVQARKHWLLLLLPVPLLALAIYAAIGAYPDWEIRQQLENLKASGTEVQYKANIEALHVILEERLLQRPENIEYRFLLANYQMSQQHYDQASAHYKVLLELLPNDADVLGYFAQAEYLREGRKITPIVSDAIDRALDINPMQKTVLGLKGIAAFEQGDLQTGIKAWEKLLVALGDDADSAGMIRQGINKAKADLAQKGIVIAVEPGITVAVDFGEALPELDPELTVFVYAKAANGPPMPLAVKRVQVKDIPAEIRLDDTMAMMPQMKLSSYEQVIIGARISFSGQPVAQKGDWQGEIAAIRWKDVAKASIKINEQVP